MAMLVRLKRYNPQRGHVLRRYSYGSVIFDGSKGWYQVDEAVAEYLKTIHQIFGNEDSPPAFDVCTSDEASRIDDAETAAARPRRSSADPIIVAKPSMVDHNVLSVQEVPAKRARKGE